MVLLVKTIYYISFLSISSKYICLFAENVLFSQVRWPANSTANNPRLPKYSPVYKNSPGLSVPFSR